MCLSVMCIKAAISHTLHESMRQSFVWKQPCVCKLLSITCMNAGFLPLCMYQKQLSVTSMKAFVSSLYGRSCQSCVWKHLPVLCMKKIVSYVLKHLSCMWKQLQSCVWKQLPCMWKQVSVTCLKAGVRHVSESTCQALQTTERSERGQLCYHKIKM